MQRVYLNRSEDYVVCNTELYDRDSALELYYNRLCRGRAKYKG